MIEIPLRLEGNGVEGFDSFVISTLNDTRSWSSAGFRFKSDPQSKFRVVLAEPAETYRLCLPLRTNGKVSCQNGPIVALNADRWRNATTDWDAGLTDYRRYMVNHEVGHLIGQRHPTPRCPEPGTEAAVMEQQTKGLAGCKGNAWPLWWEIERASTRPAFIAPKPDWQPDPIPKNLGGAVAPPAIEPETSVAPSTVAPSSSVPGETTPSGMASGDDGDRVVSTDLSTAAGDAPGMTIENPVEAADPAATGSGTGRKPAVGKADGGSNFTATAIVVLILLAAGAAVLIRRVSATSQRAGRTTTSSGNRAAQRVQRLSELNRQLGHSSSDSEQLPERD